MDQSAAVLPTVADAHTACVICSAPRTGSSLLGEALTGTGRAGRPMEYFDLLKSNEQTWIDRFKITEDKDYLEKVIAAGTTSNGVFGVKLHWHQIPALTAKFASAWGTEPKASNTALDELLQERFRAVHYLWLRRRNTVAQGISYYRATRSNIWRVRSARKTPSNAVPVVPFDFAEIDRLIKLGDGFDRGWSGFFAQSKIKPLVLIYEDFVADYENTIRTICNHIGVDSHDVPITPPVYRQLADSTSLEWEREYRRLKGVSTATDGQTSHPRPSFAEPGAEGPPAVANESRKVDAIVSANAEPAKSDPGIVVYDLNPRTRFKLVPAAANRVWMEATGQNVANRSAPLVAANQHGFFVLNPCRIRLFWTGEPTPNSVEIEYPKDEMLRYASSHLGAGIVTFSLSYSFRAPTGVNLYVKGPANMPKDGICPLESIVAADSAQATFTMNWKITRPLHPIIFEQNEPIATVFPIFSNLNSA